MINRLRNCLLQTIALLAVSSSLAFAGMLDELRQVESVALKNNLGLSAVIYDVRASEALVRKSRGVYDPLATFSAGVSRENSHGNSALYSGDDVSRTAHLRASLSQRISTGGELIISAENLRNYEEPGTPTNPSYENSWSIGFVQPLLKGAGMEAVEREITLSSFERDEATEKLRQKAASLLVEVREAYFTVLRLKEEKHYRESSVALSEEIWTHSKAKVEAGVFEPLEALEAEVGVVRRQKELLDTEKAYLDALDELSLMLGGETTPPIMAKMQLLPNVSLNESDAMRSAMSKRPELVRGSIETRKLDFENELSQKGLLPQLDLSGGYGRMGLGRDFGKSFDDFPSGDHNSWQIGLSLSIPIGNREAKNEHLRTKNRLGAQRALLDQLSLTVRNEIRRVARLVKAHEETISLAKREEELADKKLQHLLQRHKEGFVTTRQVLEGEEDLAKSRSALVFFKASYNNAITNFMNASGVLLENEGIILPDITSPSGNGGVRTLVRRRALGTK